MGPTRRKNILLLGGYYILVILGYLIFEMIPINYRPILIEGAMEASYPSSTTLLVLSVMPTLLFQINRRAKSQTIRHITAAFDTSTYLHPYLINEGVKRGEGG